MVSKSKKKGYDTFEKLVSVKYPLLGKIYCFQPRAHALERNLKRIKINPFFPHFDHKTIHL